MDTVSLSNGLKALFGTSQSTATNIPTCAADGTPAGNISVANLASVLGVTESKRISNTDINTLTKNGSYTLDTNCTHTPADGNQMMLVVFGCRYTSTTLFPIQLANYNGNLYFRYYWASWTDWRRIYDTNLLTNSTDLASLASALGVWQGGNCEDTTGLKAEFGYCGSATPNKPDGCTAGFKIGLYNSSSKLAFIIFFGWKNNGHTMYYGQTDANGSVSRWYKVTSVELT